MTVIAMITVLQGFSQNNGFKISGRVLGSSKQNIESATVILLRANDSVIIKTSVTDVGGAFIFDKLQQGNFLVSVSAAGYSTVYSNSININEANPVHIVPTLVITEISKDLQTVVIQGKRPVIEQKMDKMVVNVDALLTSAGSTVLEVLEKSPGITIDNEGEISLKGKQQVLVMLDGKPALLGPVELANLLRTMPASSVDQIEIMTNPSAKYDAAGNSGIINIRTKKNKVYINPIWRYISFILQLVPDALFKKLHM